MDGCLSHTQNDNKQKGFLAFLRLIGTLYFKKYWSAFATQCNCETPQQLLESVADTESSRKTHESWINRIREVSVKESSLKRRDYLQQVPSRDIGLVPVGLANSGKVP